MVTCPIRISISLQTSRPLPPVQYTPLRTPSDPLTASRGPLCYFLISSVSVTASEGPGGGGSVGVRSCCVRVSFRSHSEAVLVSVSASRTKTCDATPVGGGDGGHVQMHV
ncbi:unnamed protein product [Boreogadus saida]